MLFIEHGVNFVYLFKLAIFADFGKGDFLNVVQKQQCLHGLSLKGIEKFVHVLVADWLSDGSWRFWRLYRSS